MADPKPTENFREVAPEVRRFFESKGLKPTWRWDDIAPGEHAMAFTVARSAGYDILKDVRDAMAKAIRERQDFEAFRKELEPVLKAKGWWGKYEDPVTGETVQLGSVRRLKTIYWANTRTAYAAGEWEKIERTKRALPYLIYVESTAERKREEHLAWVDTILPVDHPWWETHYPPNGWGCMCRVRQISDYEAEQRGYDPANPPSPPDFGLQTFTNRKTGQVETVPRGIDPGWATNPGKERARNAAALIEGKLAAAPPEARRIAASDLAGAWLMRMIMSGGFGYDVSNKNAPHQKAVGTIATPVAVLPQHVARAIGASTTAVRFSVADAAKQGINRVKKDGQQQFSAHDYRRVQHLADHGEIIQQSEREIVMQGLVDGLWWFAAIRRAASAAHEVYLKSFRRTSERRLDRPKYQGKLLERD